MSIEVDFTVYLRGRTFTEDREELETKGYTVIPDSYGGTGLDLKKKESGTTIYKNLADFIGSFEEDIRFDYKEDYFLNEAEVCLNKIRMNINLND